jgi:hypothetical protein
MDNAELKSLALLVLLLISLNHRSRPILHGFLAALFSASLALTSSVL